MEIADALRRFRAGGPPGPSEVRFLLVMALMLGSGELRKRRMYSVFRATLLLGCAAWRPGTRRCCKRPELRERTQAEEGANVNGLAIGSCRPPWVSMLQ